MLPGTFHLYNKPLFWNVSEDKMLIFPSKYGIVAALQISMQH